jgi:hypothetical protein
MIQPGSIVIIHLTNPTEKFFAVLQDLAVAGVTFHGISLSSFDDWMAQAVAGEQTLGLSTEFVPLFRVERIFLDEAVGEVESYRQRFSKRVGMPVERYLGLEGTDESGDSGEIPS